MSQNNFIRYPGWSYTTSVITNGQSDDSNFPKFKKGDNVKHIPTGNLGVIERETGPGANGETCYWVNFDDISIGNDYAYESHLQLVSASGEPKTSGSKCTCGSFVTYGPEGLHSNWCDKYGG